MCLVSAILFCVLSVVVTIIEIVVYFISIDLLYSDWDKGSDPTTTPTSSQIILYPNSSSIIGAPGNESHLFIYMAPCSNEVWIAVAFFYLILNLLAIGLIGHLLGFHIYLMR